MRNEEWITLEGEYINQTDLAWLIDFAGRKVWCPKAHCRHAEEKGEWEVRYWLAYEKGLM